MIPDYVDEILELLVRNDAASELYWIIEDGKTIPCAMCSDFFDYATADAEPIEEGDFPLIRQVLEDLKAIDPVTGPAYWEWLFAFRKRRCDRPPSTLDRRLERSPDFAKFAGLFQPEWWAA